MMLGVLSQRTGKEGPGQGIECLGEFSDLPGHPLGRVPPVYLVGTLWYLVGAAVRPGTGGWWFLGEV